MSKYRNENYTVLKGSIPKSLKIGFKVLCTQKKLTMSCILEEMIHKWIQANAPVSTNIVDSCDEEIEDVKGYIPKSLKHQFKVLCIRKRVEMGLILHILIQQWISSSAQT